MSEPPPPEDAQSDESTVRDYKDLFLKGALGFFAILIIVATIGLYTSTTAVINTWIAREYQPIFQAVFNLIVLLTAGIGLSIVARRLR